MCWRTVIAKHGTIMNGRNLSGLDDATSNRDIKKSCGTEIDFMKEECPDEERKAKYTIEAIEMGPPREGDISNWSRRKYNYCKLYSNMCYIFVVKRSGESNCKHPIGQPLPFWVYFWQGRDVTTNKSWFIFNSQFRSVLAHELGSAFRCQRIYQQQEPVEFMRCFDRDVVVFLGRECGNGTDSQFLQMSAHSPASAGRVAYEIERIDELCPMCVYTVFAKLNTDGETEVVYIWQSERVAEEDVARAERTAYSMYPDHGVVVQRVWQGHEPFDFFWECLGGRKPVVNPPLGRPKLFFCSNSTGRFEVKKFPEHIDICQDCLKEGDVGILDDGNQHIYIWVGQSACVTLTLKAARVAQIYSQRASFGTHGPPDYQRSLHIVRQYSESAEFRRHFPIWF